MIKKFSFCFSFADQYHYNFEIEENNEAFAHKPLVRLKRQATKPDVSEKPESPSEDKTKEKTKKPIPIAKTTGSTSTPPGSFCTL